MRKDIKQRIEITTSSNRIHFYVRSREYGCLYLFSQKYSRGVYNYFRNGRSMSEIRNFHNWNNFRLEKTILRIPRLVRYVIQETAENELWDDGRAV